MAAPAQLRQVDGRIGAAVVLLAAAVLWSARSFPAVPGQDLGAGFLPMLVGAGLLLCGLGLLWRSWQGTAYADSGATSSTAPRAARRDIASAALVIGVVLAYLLLSDVLGFLLLAPPGLLLLFMAFGVRPLPAVLWAVGGAVLVHLVFYKLLRVPLPWGLLRPFY